LFINKTTNYWRNIYIYSPTGTTLLSSSASNNEIGVVTLPSIGDYNFSISGNDRWTGPFTFSIIDIENDDTYYSIGKYSTKNSFSIKDTLFNTTINASISEPGVFHIYTLTVPHKTNVYIQIIKKTNPSYYIEVKLLNSTCQRQPILSYSLWDNGEKSFSLSYGGEYVIQIGRRDNSWIGDYGLVIKVFNQPDGKIPRIEVCRVVDACDKGAFTCDNSSNTIISTPINLTEPVIHELNNITLTQGGEIFVQYGAIVKASNISVKSGSKIILEDGSLLVSDVLDLQSQSNLEINVDYEPPSSYIDVGTSGCATIETGTELKIRGAYTGTRTIMKTPCLSGKISYITVDKPGCQNIIQEESPPKMIMVSDFFTCTDASYQLMISWVLLSLAYLFF